MEENARIQRPSTFIVQILYQQNSTWQGTVKWVEAQKSQQFRSALELIRLLDNAVGVPAEAPAFEDETEQAQSK